MAISFNLIDRPWIPCRPASGGSPTHLGLAESLARAREIEEIADPCPLITVALHRLLLAVLHRSFGPRSLSEWAVLWAAGAWPAAPLERYWSDWHARFDLFDGDHPFYQVASLNPDLSAPSSRLLPELASGNNATLFDHTTDEGPPALSPAEAARYLLAAQAFSVGGLVSRESSAERSAKAAPLAKGAVALVRGRTLFETLMLNLLRYDPEAEEPFPVHGADVPAWERAAVDRPQVRRPAGYLDLLTWQSRRIRLLPTESPIGEVGVTRVVIMKGTEFPDDFTLHGYEPMLAFRKQLRAQRSEAPWLPVGFTTERALWRDSLALLHSLDNKRTRPRTLDWVSALVDAGSLDRVSLIPLDLFGLCTTRAKVLFWREERVALPPAYLTSGSNLLLPTLERGLALSEETAELLNRAATRLAQEILADTDRRPDPRKLAALSARFEVGHPFWSRLELPFRQLLRSLPDTPEDALVTGDPEPLRAWAAAVRQSARQAWAEALRGLDGARTLRAATRADRWFHGVLTARLSPLLTPDATQEVTP